VRPNHARPLAFTLIEMLLVVVIIGVLAGMVIPMLSGRSQEARVTRAKADISGNLSVALDLFEQDCGRYPTDSEGLSALEENPNVAGWKGPYLKTKLKPDPWGNPYTYSVDPENSGRYLLRSSGPDGQVGNDDDITE
jgi:general secretion pathway protein G